MFSNSSVSSRRPLVSYILDEPSTSFRLLCNMPLENYCNTSWFYPTDRLSTSGHMLPPGLWLANLVTCNGNSQATMLTHRVLDEYVGLDMVYNIRPGRATLAQFPGGVIKIVVSTRQVKSWSPGSFVLLCLPRFGLGQSHPATIASTPNSHGDKLVFLHESTSRLYFSCSRQCQRCLTAGSFIGIPTSNSTFGNIVPGINRRTVRR
jgi:hypothetical protein